MQLKVVVEDSQGKHVYDSLEAFFQRIFAPLGDVNALDLKAEFIYRQQIIAGLGLDPLLDLLRAFNITYAAFFAVQGHTAVSHWTARVYRDILTVNPITTTLEGAEAHDLFQAKSHTGTAAELPQKENVSKFRQFLRRFKRS